MSLKSIIGGFVQVPKAGLSAAQVQALIDAAQRVIGTCDFDSATGFITWHDGVFDTATPVSASRLDFVFVTPQPNTKYTITVELYGLSDAVSVVIHNKADTGFQLRGRDIAGSEISVGAFSGTVTISRISP